MTNKIKVVKVKSAQELALVHKIRCQVFVEGQNVPLELEIDQFEETAKHFLALIDKTPCGAARWRFTQNGVKLERFAVLARFRGMGVGTALMDAVLKDIKGSADARGKTLYLHAQLPAMPLYEKFGFNKVGKLFQECDINHYKMVLM